MHKTPALLPTSEDSFLGSRDWPHAPPHRLSESGVYMITSRTKAQSHLLASRELKDWFQEKLFELIDEFHWQLEAWAILSNHYHFVAHSPQESPDGATSLRPMIQKLHSLTTKEVNRREGRSGRMRLWQNYRETHLTYQRSYLARLNYVHQNAAHHRLVPSGTMWKWCSAAAFAEAATPAWFQTISSFRYDEIARDDGD